MSNFLAQWFSSQGFLPRGQSYLWTPELLWTYVIADAVVGIACFAIPLALITYARRRYEYRSSNWTIAILTGFVFICGITHFIAIWSIWHPVYWLDAMTKAAAAFTSVGAVMLLWLVIRRLRQAPTVKEQRKIIQQLEHEIEERKKAENALRQSQATLRELAAYQERIREDERKRIAREIHDELGQNLLALRLDVSALQARAGERHPLLQERATTALEYIDTTMKSIRSIMNNLRPSVLDLGLPAAIGWQLRQFERRTGVPCELQMNDDGIDVPEAQATAVFRILQESLNNIGRHARATRVRIALYIEDGILHFSIRDNGVGMFPGDRRKVRRFGLIGIQERVTMLGGELTIDSSPGQGTVLQMTIPMHIDAEQALASGC
ncbi:MAG TPA: sensor histidine kinase [Noviherbaspirillum sp.]